MRRSSFSPDAQDALVEARTLTLAAGRPAIGSGALLVACAGDREGAGLLAVAGIDGRMLARHLRLDPGNDTGAASPATLLAAIGIDLAEVRSRLPPVGTAGLELRRSRLRPLRLTLEGAGRPVPFDAQGRKVLEVATWHGRRERRPARPADLLRGVLCDGRDPVCATLAELAGGRLRDLFAALFEGRRPAA